jgi:hypothetical protein
MTTLLSPSYSLQIGPQIWKEQLLRLELTLTPAPGIDVLSVTLPAKAPLDAAVDDDVELTLNSGEQEEKVFTGTVSVIRRSHASIEIKAVNAGGVLSRYRPAATYENATPATVVRNLASDAGVTTGSLETGTGLAFYVADPCRTAWDHIYRVSTWCGAMVTVSADNKVESRVVNATTADVALRHGRELLSLARKETVAPLDSFVVAGESGVGSVSSMDVHRPTTDFFAGNRPDDPSPSVVWTWEPALRTASAAATAGAARKRTYGAKTDRGTFTAFLQPKLRPGTVLELQDLPDRLAGGPVWIHSVRHTLSPAGAGSRVDYRKGGDSFDPLALLGSLAGSLGGLA